MSEVIPWQRFPAIIYFSIKTYETYFWSRIAWTTTGSFESLAGLVHIAEAKVNDLERPVEVNEQVFGFQISVADAQFMNMVCNLPFSTYDAQPEDNVNIVSCGTEMLS